MILAFLLLFILLILLLQQISLDNSMDSLEGDFWPSENIVDQEDLFDLTLTISNHSHFPVFYLKLEVPFQDAFRVHPPVKRIYIDPVTKGPTATLSTWIKGNQKMKLQVPVSASKRGRYLLLHPNIFCGDFLGLKEKKKEMPQYREVVVTPTEYKGQEMDQVLGRFLGDFSVRRFLYEDPVLTIGFREYTGREPQKMISWQQTAKRQALMVKEYDHTVEPAISIFVNVHTLEENKSELLEKCFSMARSVCKSLEAKGISYSFFTNAQLAGSKGDLYSVNEGLGSRHFSKVLELLGRSTYASVFSFETLITCSDEHGSKNCGKIIITATDLPSVAKSDSQTLVLDARLL